MNDHTGVARRRLSAPLVPGIRRLAWTEIRAVAVDLVRNGWPVLPGTTNSPSTGPGWAGLVSVHKSLLLADVGDLRDQLQAQRDREQSTLAELGNLS